MYDGFNRMYDRFNVRGRTLLILLATLIPETMENRFTPPLELGEFYLAPALEVVEIAVERGFAGSDYSEVQLPEYSIVDEEDW